MGAHFPIVSTAELVGFGSLAAVTRVTTITAVAMVGLGELTAEAVPVAIATADLVGVGAIGTQPTTEADANLIGTGTLTAAVVPVAIGALNLTGVGALAANSLPVAVAAGDLSGVGAITATGTATPVVTDPLVGIGTLTAVATAEETGVTYSDNFNRANGALGSNWVTIAETPLIVSNQAQGGTTGAINTYTQFRARWTNAVLTDTQEVSGTVGTPSTAATPALAGGLILRCNSSGDHVSASITNTAVYIVTRTSGTDTQQATTGSLTIPAGTAVRFTAVGNVYRIYLNGSATPTATWTDSGNLIAIGSGTRYVGLFTSAHKNFIGTTDQFGYCIDNWVGKDL